MSTIATSEHALSIADIEQYHREGYLIPSYRIETERIDQLRSTLDRLLRENPGVRPEKLVSAHIEGPNGEGVRGSRDFLALAHDPKILDIVAQLIGDDVILWGCHIFCKPAHEGLETPFHQDGHYWPIRPLATCSVWVALDASVHENGCLQVVPRSHLARRSYEHLHEDRDDLVLNQRLAADTFQQRDAVALELQPGQMSLHDVYMIHGANVNRSPNRRAGVALRYMPASSVFERNLNPVAGKSGVPVSFATRPLWLLRGKDRSGRNDFQVGHPPGQRGN
jgi:ectoine hydroxylase-related dioxygenase (phytanoyl-CoA dioxygenase family)